MSTTPELPRPLPPPMVTLNATPDGKYVTITTTIFVEVPAAKQIGDVLTDMVRQLTTGLIIPQTNGGMPT